MKQVINAKGLSEEKTTTLRDAAAISAKELAKMLSLSPRTVWRLLSAGKLPKPVSIGGSKRFLMSDVSLFLECGCDISVYLARKEGEKC